MQFAAILYPSMMVARTGTTTQSKYRQFLMTYTLLDFLLYPLDTLKTIKYATNPKMVSKILVIKVS